MEVKCKGGCNSDEAANVTKGPAAVFDYETNDLIIKSGPSLLTHAGTCSSIYYKPLQYKLTHSVVW